MDQNRARNYIFGHFLKLGLSVFLEVPYIDSLKQCITSSRGKTYEKKFSETRYRAKRAKIGSEPIFFAIFSSLVH